MKLQEQYEEKRRENLNNRISHEEFYLWLADSIHIIVSNLPVPIETIRQSTDPHLNDIPLHKWDSMDGIVRRKAASYGMHSWSLCDTVCVLKCFARRAAR